MPCYPRASSAPCPGAMCRCMPPAHCSAATPPEVCAASEPPDFLWKAPPPPLPRSRMPSAPLPSPKAPTALGPRRQSRRTTPGWCGACSSTPPTPLWPLTTSPSSRSCRCASRPRANPRCWPSVRQYCMAALLRLDPRSSAGDGPSSPGSRAGSAEAQSCSGPPVVAARCSCRMLHGGTGQQSRSAQRSGAKGQLLVLPPWLQVPRVLSLLWPQPRAPWHACAACCECRRQADVHSQPAALAASIPAACAAPLAPAHPSHGA